MPTVTRAEPEARPGPRIGSPRAQAERDADRLADTLTAPQPQPAPCVACASGSAPCPACAASARRLSPNRSRPSPTNPLLGRALASPASPLPATTRRRFEQRLGGDLGPIALHRGSAADTATAATNASAFASGGDIVLGRGAPPIDTPAGERLLAHEVAHSLAGGDEIRRFVPDDVLRSTLTPAVAATLSDADLRHAHGLVLSSLASTTDPTLRQAAETNRDTLAAEATARGLDLTGNAALSSRLEGEDASLPITFEAEEVTDAGLLVDPRSAFDGGTTPTVAPPPLQPLVLPGAGGGDTHTTPGLPGLSGGAVSSGLSSHILAMGEHASRSSSGELMTIFGSRVGGPCAFTSTLEGMSSPAYMGSFMPRPGTIVLDRVVDTAPRDLYAYYEAVRAGRPSPGNGLDLRTIDMNLSTGVRQATDADLLRIPRLIEEFNAGTINAADRELLVTLARIHADGTPRASPFASYMTPGAEAPNVGRRLFRVRIEVPRGMALDHRFENAAEAEFLLSLDHQGRLTQVGAGTGVLESGSRLSQFLVRNGTRIRWAGRIAAVAGVAYGGYRIATAAPTDRGRVIGEEAGSLALGTLGTMAATAGCVAFGVATGGVGLFVCGLVGGVAAGALGSYVGGEVGERMQHDPLGPATWVVNAAVHAYTDPMVQSADPVVRADGIALQRVIYQDDSFSMMYLMNRMCGGCLSYPGGF